jgi:hypothetical protein
MGNEGALIGYSQARARTGQALFGDDWIGELSKSDLKLLSGPYGPQRKNLANGRAISIVTVCPAKLRGKLERAIGRAERAYLQEATVIDLLHDHGFSDTEKAFKAGQLETFLSKIRGPRAEARKRTVGKPRDKIEAVKLRMASDIRGALDIESLKGKELADKYGVSRGTAVAARKEVLEKLAR